MVGGLREVTDQMNSDMFENVERASYDISGFSRLEIDQAKQAFNHNGYKAYEKENELQIKKS